MNILEVVKDLKERGYEVYVSHFRCTPQSSLLFTTKELKDKNKPISAKGGLTYVTLKGPYFSITELAECSLKDNFSRKLGTTIALGRALKTLKMEEKELPKYHQVFF